MMEREVTASVRTGTRRWWLGWLALAAPALLQIGLLFFTMFSRVGYPYDLEWMEGGLLNHAARIADGSGIYVAPSLDFIPYLYTPLYPGLLALLEPLTGINYQVGRAISILAVIGLMAIAIEALVARVARQDRPAALAGALAALGYFAATYPWVSAWYDLVRADTLALAIAFGGVSACAAWARTGRGWQGQARIGLAAAVLALSFFAKQTGIFFVAAGGAIVLVKNWRRVPIYVAVAGTIGLGGTWLLDRTTGGWFWTYAYEVHQTHECNADRFWDAFGQILFKFPFMTAAVALGLLAVATAAIVGRRLPRSAAPLLTWSWVFAVGIIVGAVGIGTQWSEKNAYIPAMLAGAIAAGAAIPAIAGSVDLLFGSGGNAKQGGASRRRPVGQIAAMVVLFAMVIDLVLLQRWEPAKWIPTERDRAAGDALIEEIRAVDGEVFIPFHPWYARKAGKRVYTHRMGVLDMRFQPPRKLAAPQCFFHDVRGKTNWPVRGLPDAFANRYFAAVFWDNRHKNYFSGFTQHYRLDDILGAGKSPRLYSGATGLVPKEIWVPAKKLDPPEGARVLFDFEDGSYDDWAADGEAWGRRPERNPLRRHDQGPVRRYGGRWFATSMHGGDDAVGTLTSDEFVIDGKRITFRLGGGTEQTGLHDEPRSPEAEIGAQQWLRVELIVDGKVVRHATKPAPSSERMDEITWIIPEYEDQPARIIAIDNARGSWAHINIDEFWIWDDAED